MLCIFVHIDVDWWWRCLRYLGSFSTLVAEKHRVLLITEVQFLLWPNAVLAICTLLNDACLVFWALPVPLVNLSESLGWHSERKIMWCTIYFKHLAVMGTRIVAN